jgi:hypothetical protein
VLDCWLRKTYLPAGEWAQACRADIANEQKEDMSKAIDKEIIEYIDKKYGKKAKK